MTENTNIVQERNKAYFRAFVDGRGTLDNPALYLSTLLIGAVLVVPYWLVPKDYGMNSLYNPIVVTLLIFNAINLLLLFAIVIPYLKKKLYQYQRFSSIWQVLFSYSLTINLVFLAVFMIVAKKGSFSYSPIYAVCFVFGIIYILSMLYHIYWLRSQMQHGFSPEHTEGNYLSQKKVQSAGSMALIFSGTLLGRYMTAGQANIFGMVAGLLFVMAFSRLNLEYIYVMILKWRDKEYWEAYRPEDGVGGTSKKTKAFIRIFFELLFIIGLAYLRTEILPANSPLIPILKLIPKFVLVYWGLRIVIWGYRKIKDRENSTE